jgi:hypothetical protein
MIDSMASCSDVPVATNRTGHPTGLGVNIRYGETSIDACLPTIGDVGGSYIITDMGVFEDLQVVYERPT